MARGNIDVSEKKEEATPVGEDASSSRKARDDVGGKMLLHTQGDYEAADLPATLDIPTIGSAMSSWRTRRARSQSSSSPSVTSSATATERLSSLKPVSVSVSRPRSDCFRPTPNDHSSTNVVAERPFAFDIADCSNEKISLAVAIVQARRKAGQFPPGLFAESSQGTASPAGGKSPPRAGGPQKLEERGQEESADPSPSRLVGDEGAPNEKAFGSPVTVVHKCASLHGEISSSSRKARDDVGGKMLLHTQGDYEAADLPATLDIPTIGSAMSSWRTRRARSQSSSSPSVTSSATATERLSSLKPVSVSVSRPRSDCFRPTPNDHSSTNVVAERPFAFDIADCSNEKISLAVAIVQARRKAGQFPPGLFAESSQGTASPAGGKSPPRGEVQEPSTKVTDMKMTGPPCGKQGTGATVEPCCGSGKDPYYGVDLGTSEESQDFQSLATSLEPDPSEEKGVLCGAASGLSVARVGISVDGEKGENVDMGTGVDAETEKCWARFQKEAGRGAQNRAGHIREERAEMRKTRQKDVAAVKYRDKKKSQRVPKRRKESEETQRFSGGDYRASSEPVTKPPDSEASSEPVTSGDPEEAPGEGLGVRIGFDDAEIGLSVFLPSPSFPKFFLVVWLLHPSMFFLMVFIVSLFVCRLEDELAWVWEEGWEQGGVEEARD